MLDLRVLLENREGLGVDWLVDTDMPQSGDKRAKKPEVLVLPSYGQRKGPNIWPKSQSTG